jgi:uncharacterized protein YyaL (SSP411 family)
MKQFLFPNSPAGMELRKAKRQDRIRDLKEKLLQVRDETDPPSLDDKSLLSWNALMNIALTKAAIALEDEDYLRQAESHMNWMSVAFLDAHNALMHTWKGWYRPHSRKAG